MSATAHADHHIVDHLCNWSRTGHDGARLDRPRMRRRGAQQHPSDVTIAVAIALGRRIVPPGLLDQSQPRDRSAFAAPIACPQSP